MFLLHFDVDIADVVGLVVLTASKRVGEPRRWCADRKDHEEVRCDGRPETRHQCVGCGGQDAGLLHVGDSKQGEGGGCVVCGGLCALHNRFDHYPEERR